jgi:hypothetical protein
MKFTEIPGAIDENFYPDSLLKELLFDGELPLELDFSLPGAYGFNRDSLIPFDGVKPTKDLSIIRAYLYSEGNDAYAYIDTSLEELIADLIDSHEMGSNGNPLDIADKPIIDALKKVLESAISRVESIQFADPNQG